MLQHSLAVDLFKCIVGSMFCCGELSEVPTTGGCPLLGGGTYYLRTCCCEKGTELTRRNGHVQPAIWLPLGARSELPQSCLFCCDRAYTCVSGRKEWCVQLQFLPMIDRPRYGSRRAYRRGLMPSSPVPSILVQTQPAGIVHGQRRCIAST